MSGPRYSGQQSWIKPGIIIAGLAAITLLHYLTTTSKPLYHDIYIRLYYLPIILAAFWFGLAGGICSAVAASLLYLPHLILQWPGGASRYPYKAIEIILFNLVGLLTGYLVRQEVNLRERLEETFHNLKRSHEELARRSDKIRELETELIQRDRLAILG